MGKFVNDNVLALDVLALRWVKKSDTRDYNKEMVYKIEFCYRGSGSDSMHYKDAAARDAMFDRICAAMQPRPKP